MSEPLAHKIRPKNLDEFIGQEHLVGKDKPIRVAIEKRHLFSFALWGPPGCGKTTLAKIYAASLDADLFELSAVSASKDDIRKIVNAKETKSGTKKSQPKLAVSGKPKVVFLDEIHRFNKAQQDFLLPYVESGEITLIGATTENPSFEIIAPLLSRMRVFVLNELSKDDLKTIITRTGLSLDKKATEWLIDIANGDARQLIGILEQAHKLYTDINVETLTETIQNRFLRYDKHGEEHYNTISAFIKSMRAGDPDAALYYLARMIEAGEDPKFIARRMIIFASEDVGMAQPTALVVANEVFKSVETIGLPECAINLAHGAVYLALAPKDRTAYEGLFSAIEDVKKRGNLPIPLSLRNAPTKLMKNLGYGKGYEKYTNKSLLPDELTGKKYYFPKKKNGKDT